MTLALAAIVLFYVSACLLLLIAIPKLHNLHRNSYQYKVAQIRYDVFDYATRTNDAYADTKFILKQALPATLDDAWQSSALKIVFDSIMLRSRGCDQTQAQQTINTILGDVRQSERLKIKVLIARLCDDINLYLLHQCPALLRHSAPDRLSDLLGQRIDDMVSLWVHSRLQLHMEDHDLQSSHQPLDTGWASPDDADSEEEIQDDFKDAA